MKYQWFNENCPWLMLLGGIFFILIGIHSIYKIVSCKEEIEAILVRKERRNAGKGHSYIGIFKYNYYGVEHTVEVGLWPNSTAEYYIPNTKYKIYINSKKHKYGVIDNKINFQCIFPILFGITIFFVYLVK